MRRIAAVLLVAVSFSLAAADAPELRDRGARAGRAVILEVAQPLTPEDRADLAGEGVFVRHALSGGRYLARVADGVQVRDARIATVEPLTAEKKIHASAYQEVASGRTWAELHVFFHRDIALEDAERAIVAAGGALVQPLATRFSPMRHLTAKFPPAALEAIASDDRVLSVAAPRRWKVASDNAKSAAAAHVTELYSAPYGLSGAGVTVSLFELGAAQADHVEFGGRLTVVGFTGSSGDKQHATHVAGTIGASGVDARAKGMAPAVRIQQRCVATGSNGCESDWMEDKDLALAALGVAVDNNSWGYVLGWSAEDYPVWNNSDQYYGAYDLMVTAPLDQISIDRNILFVHSAGNDGNPQSFSDPFAPHRHVDDQYNTIKDKLFCYSVNESGTDCPTTCTGGCETTRHHTITPYDTQGVTASAKNVVSVGAVRVLDTNGNINISSFSSRGPAKDGRVKPDVVSRGQDVLSSTPNNGYTTQQGTSMAAPSVTGIAALLVEQWRKTFHGASPTAADLKALLIAGTDDLGTAGPDYTFGFGMVNAKKSVDAILADEGRGSRIRSVTLGQAQTHEMQVLVTEPQTLRVVMHWADPMIIWMGGSDIAEKALVNDLDVKVIDPQGGEHFPYILDKSNYTVAATRGVNTVDNTEMVEIPNATPGLYRIVANGRVVPEGPQRAVVVTSADLTRPCIDPSEGAGNDTPERAYGDLVTGQTVSAGLCTTTDIDYYKFTVTKNGEVSVAITAGSTPVLATLAGGSINSATTIPANTTSTITANVDAVPLGLLLRIEAGGTRGADAEYSFVPQFGSTIPQRRRSAR